MLEGCSRSTVTNWPPSCASAASGCARRTSACPRPPAAAPPACAARRWRCWPACRSTTTSGWSRHAGPQPSAQLLGALSRALRLTRDEHDHLFHLSGLMPEDENRSPTEHVRPGVLHLLDKLDDTPAMVVSDRGDILAWNAMHAALMGDPGRCRRSSATSHGSTSATRTPPRTSCPRTSSATARTPSPTSGPGWPPTRTTPACGPSSRNSGNAVSLRRACGSGTT